MDLAPGEVVWRDVGGDGDGAQIGRFFGAPTAAPCLSPLMLRSRTSASVRSVDRFGTKVANTTKRRTDGSKFSAKENAPARALVSKDPKIL